MQHLGVRGNNLGDEAGKALAEMLKDNQTLQHLNVSGNNLGDEAGKVLAEMLKVNQTLQHLDIDHDNIHDADKVVIEQALEVNRQRPVIISVLFRIRDRSFAALGPKAQRSSG